jgi:hypothetical protein
VKKILREILALLWKVFRLVLWKWLRPMLGKIMMYGVIIIAVVTIIAVIVTR